MRLLLDTHVLLWLMNDNERLTRRARQLIDDAAEVFVSTVSIWELAIKWRVGEMEENPQELVATIGKAGLIDLPVEPRHALVTAQLPLHHRDPFDRMLIAQAISETMHLLTADPHLAPYSELVITV